MRSSTPRRAFLAGLAAMGFGLSSCNENGTVPAVSESSAHGYRFFQAGTEGLKQVDAPAVALKRDTPWPKAVRVVGICGIEGTLYVGVNSYGYARFSAGSVTPELFTDPAFQGLTIGSAHALRGGLIVLLYPNEAFGAPEGHPTSRILELPTGQSAFFDSTIPAGRDGFQAVQLIMSLDGSWAVEMKKASEDRVEWLRLLIAPDGTESPLLESHYRAVAETASSLDASFAGAVTLAGRAFSICDLDSGTTKILLPSGFDGDLEAACISDATLYVMKGSQVIEAKSDKTVAEAPPLPKGFRFTGLARHGEGWLASYEEGDWPCYGSSGVVLFQ